jgi:serine/threonine protein kinase
MTGTKTAPEIGGLLGHRYRIERPLGSGGMGMVLAAHDTVLDRPVAIKLATRADQRATDRLVREARALARIVHPGIVQVFDRGDDPGHGPYVVMERLVGQNLAAFLHARGPLPPVLAVALLEQLCGTLQAAHDAGVVHRDLKPSNVFLVEGAAGEVPRVKVVDFGTAKLVDGEDPLTDPGDLLGTLAYMPPEQWDSVSEADERSDVYALGAIAFELLTGTPPFRAPTRAALCLSILHDDPPSVRTRCPAASPALAAAVARALGKRPEQRFASVTAFAQALGLTALTPPADRNAPGFLGTSRYRVVRLIGGGQGTEVYAAQDLERDRTVALKRLTGRGGEALLRLKREFRSLAGLHHPNLVRLHEIVEAEGQVVLVMELVDGKPLLEHVTGSPERLRGTIDQLLAALGALHGRGLAHRDLKPSNVLVEPTGRVVLLDGGLAAPFGGQGRVEGTARYMSPEALEGQIGPAGDLYAVGMILREALAGLGAAVPEDLAALADRLLVPDPAGRGTVEEARRAVRPGNSADLSGDSRRASFVGRDEALAVMEEALGRAAGGTPTVLWVVGPSGIGKTALIEEFGRRLAREGRAVTLASRARDTAVPFPALDGAVDELSSHLLRLAPAALEAILPRRCAPLAQLFPVMTRVAAVDRATTLAGHAHDSPQLRREAFAALRELLRRLCQRQPVVMSIDDVQWLDADSAELLAHLLTGADAPPLLVLGALRVGATESPALVSLETRVAPPVRLHLGPLSAAEARVLVHDRWRGRAPLDDEASARLIDQGAGIPFFLEMLAAEPSVTVASAAALGDVIAARWRRLDPAPRRALERICLSSRPLPAHVASSADDEVLAPLFASALIRGVRVDERWLVEPYHARIGETVRAAMEERLRREHHLEIARLLRGDPHADPELLVEHMAGGGDERGAAEVALASARAANAQLAFGRAAALFGVALAHGRLFPLERVAICRSQALALQNAGRRREAGELLLRTAEALEDPILAAELRTDAGVHLVLSGHVRAGLELLAPALARAQLDEVLDLGQLLPATGAALGALMARGLTAPARPVVDDELLARIDLCLVLAQGLAHLDLRAVAFACHGLRLAVEADEPRRLQRACALFVINSVGSVPNALTGPALERCRLLTLASREPYARALLHAAEAEVAHFEGRFLAAEGSFERAERILVDSCVGATRELATVRDVAAFIQYAQKGDFRTQLERTQRWLVEADAAQDLFHASMLRVAHAIVWIAQDDPRRARAELARAQAEWTGAAGVLEVAATLYSDVADRYEGREELDQEAAQARAAALQSPAAQTPFLGGYLTFQVVWRDLRALASRRAGPEIAAVTRTSIEGLRSVGLDMWRAVADALEANLDWLAGQRDRAVERLEQSEQTFRRLHMLCLAACARKRRGQLTRAELGQRLQGEADAELRTLGVLEPDRWARAYWSMFDAATAPGPSDDTTVNDAGSTGR